MADEKNISKEEDNEDNDEWMGEGAEYSPKSEYSKAKLCYDASQRCVEARAKEMKRGYYNTTITKDGLPLRTWIEDSRKAYCSTVLALKVILTPEIEEEIRDKKKERKKEKSKKKVNHPIIETQKAINQSYKRFAYHVLEPKIINGKKKHIKTDRYFMPEIDSSVSVRKILPDGNEELTVITGHWNNYVNAYLNNQVVLYDKMFKELMNIIHRKNYFKQAISF